MTKSIFPLLIIAVIAAVIFVSGCVSEGFTGTTVTGNEIVFASDKDSVGNELYLMNEDGTNVRQLTYNEYEDNNPAFSPDKTKVAFHRTTNPADGTTYEVYILDLLTGEETRLTHNNYLDGHPDWSPDGTKTIFARYTGFISNADLYVIDLETGQETQLTNTTDEENDPEWSPDGTMIAFKSTQNTNTTGREEIYVMDADGTNIRRLTNVTGWESDHDPSWSSDSKYIYFERFEGLVPWYRIQETLFFLANWELLSPWNIYMVDLEGNLHNITDCEYICWLPVQYRDRIMYLKDEFGIANGTLYSLKVDYATILPDGTEDQIPLKDDEYAFKKAYFDF